MVLILVMIISPVFVIWSLMGLFSTDLVVASIHVLELYTVPLAVDQFVIEV